MVNKHGEKESLTEYHDNENISYDFGVSNNGYCFEYTYDKNKKEITYRNSDGLSRGFDKPKQETNEERKDTKSEFFDEVVTKTLVELKELLVVKGKEYRRNNNVYHNFDQGAKIKGITPEKVLDGFLLKHEVSIADITDDLDKGILPTKEKVEEKFNDNIIYLLIKKAMILDRLK
jgi:hypothetical protein